MNLDEYEDMIVRGSALETKKPRKKRTAKPPKKEKAADLFDKKKKAPAKRGRKPKAEGAAYAGARAGAIAGAKPGPKKYEHLFKWIDFVKMMAKELGITYPQAMRNKDVQALYKKAKQDACKMDGGVLMGGITNEEALKGLRKRYPKGAAKAGARAGMKKKMSASEEKKMRLKKDRM